MAINHISVVTRLREFGKGRDKEAIKRFFKSEPGQPGAGDVFVGATVPEVRSVAKQFAAINHRELVRLLGRREHEARMCALEIIKIQYAQADDHKRYALVSFYLEQSEFVNNWDLVDLSASAILGEYLAGYQMTSKDGPKRLGTEGVKLLRSLAHSESIWERRIAMVATHALIKRGYTAPTFDIATILMSDTNDLIHKAIGWMLREAGKQDEKALHVFLDRHAATMPRTALRYAIERFTPNQREMYMARAKEAKVSTLEAKKE